MQPLIHSNFAFSRQDELNGTKKSTKITEAIQPISKAFKFFYLIKLLKRNILVDTFTRC